MTDKEFLDTFIVERMQLHYSSEHPPLAGDELSAALQLEAEYNHALEKLPPEDATAIKKFHETVTHGTPPILNFHADRVNEKNKAKIMADKDFSNQNRMDAFNISRYQNKIDLLSTNAATLDPDQCGFVQFQTILKQRREC